MTGCHSCRKVFPNEMYFREHFILTHKRKHKFVKPAWMDNVLFEKTTHKRNTFFCEIKCICGLRFETYLDQEDKSQIPELLFHLHRQEQCKMVRQISLNEIKNMYPMKRTPTNHERVHACGKCYLKFLSEEALTTHLSNHATHKKRENAINENEICRS